MYTTQKQVRQAFRVENPELDYRKITDYSGHGKMFKTDTRCAFSNWLDSVAREGLVSNSLAQRVTL